MSFISKIYRWLWLTPMSHAEDDRARVNIGAAQPLGGSNTIAAIRLQCFDLKHREEALQRHIERRIRPLIEGVKAREDSITGRALDALVQSLQNIPAQRPVLHLQDAIAAVRVNREEVISKRLWDEVDFQQLIALIAEAEKLTYLSDLEEYEACADYWRECHPTLAYPWKRGRSAVEDDTGRVRTA